MGKGVLGGHWKCEVCF